MHNLSQFVESRNDRNSRDIKQITEQVKAHSEATNIQLDRVQKELTALREIVDRLFDIFLHEKSKPQQVREIESRIDSLIATYQSIIMETEENLQFVCCICEATFQNNALLENHTAKHHNWNESILHIEMEPAEQSRNIESIPEMISYLEQSIVEVRENVEKFQSQSNPKPCICQYCDAEFSNKNEFKIHIDRRHNADTWRNCSRCFEKICPEYEQIHSVDCLTIEISNFKINDDDITSTRIL